MSVVQHCLMVAAITVVMACGVSANSQNTLKPEVRERVDSLPEWHVAYRIFPIEKPIWDEGWINPSATPNAVHRFVFIPHGRGLNFYVTFVAADSDEHAHAMWERSRFSVQMDGKTSKEFGSDELVAWDSHLAARWAHTVVAVYTDGTKATPGEWSSVMEIVESALLGKPIK